MCFHGDLKSYQDDNADYSQLTLETTWNYSSLPEQSTFTALLAEFL